MYNIDPKTILWRKADPELVVLNLKTGHYYMLDEIGIVLWEGLLKNLPPETIAKKMVEEFEVDYKTALEDTRECIEQLTAAGIITK